MHGLILLTIGWMGRKIVGWMPPLTHQSNGYNRNPMENGWLHGLMLFTMGWMNGWVERWLMDATNRIDR